MARFHTALGQPDDDATDLLDGPADQQPPGSISRSRHQHMRQPKDRRVRNRRSCESARPWCLCPLTGAACARIELARNLRGGAGHNRLVAPEPKRWSPFTPSTYPLPAHRNACSMAQTPSTASASQRPRPRIARWRHGPASPAAPARIHPVLRLSSPGNPFGRQSKQTAILGGHVLPGLLVVDRNGTAIATNWPDADRSAPRRILSNLISTTMS